MHYCNAKNQTALDLACEEDKVEIVKLLYEKYDEGLFTSYCYVADSIIVYYTDTKRKALEVAIKTRSEKCADFLIQDMEL